jgi:hypothetical protein
MSTAIEDEMICLVISFTFHLDCEALGLIPRRLRRNSKAFFINQYPAPWGGVVNCGILYLRNERKGVALKG